MYIMPAPYKCVKCGFEFAFSPHNTHPAPVYDNKPVCPQCWSEFLKMSLGFGVRIIKNTESKK
jgi:DNA-directed RNA polymerase subunit RPC12/RpoP